MLGIGAVLVWTVMSGQFEDIDQEGARVLEDEEEPRR
ncbi:MAG: cbb3-type cytochrome oxidase assembly protein [Burkholderiaceae bacterium]